VKQAIPLVLLLPLSVSKVPRITKDRQVSFSLLPKDSLVVLCLLGAVCCDDASPEEATAVLMVRNLRDLAISNGARSFFFKYIHSQISYRVPSTFG
jgi:hypothetical protein